MNNDLNPSPAPLESLSPGRQFLILLGMYLIGIALGNGVGVMCFSLLCDMNITEMAYPDFTNQNVLLATYIGQIVGTFLTFVLPAFLFTWFTTRNRIEYLRINHIGKISLLLLAGVGMVCASPLIDFLADLNSKIHFPDVIKRLEDAANKEQDAFLRNQTMLRFVANIFMIGLLAAFCEEFFFRAVLQKMLIKWTKNVHWGVWITGAVFSILHFEFYGFLPRMLMGVYLGYLFVWSGSLWVPIFAHFINNALVVIVIYLNPAMVDSDKINFGSDSQQMLYLSISIVVVTGVLVLANRLRDRKTETIVS